MTEPRAYIEIIEQPGFHDDCFRSAEWTKIQSSVSESFQNTDDASGDYATMEVTEGAAVNGAGWRREVDLTTDTFPLIRVRLRGRGTTPQYKVEAEYTDTSTTTTGWTNAPSDFAEINIELTSGKTLKYLKLYARSNTAYQTAMVDYDYLMVLRYPPLVPLEVEELEADLITNTGVSTLKIAMFNDVLLGVTERWYHIDEDYGTHAYDHSNNKHQSTHNGTWTTGKHGKALYLGGSARINTGYKPTITATDCISICFWVKASPGASGIVAGFGQTDATWNRVQFNWSSDKLRLYVRDDSGNTVQYTTTATIADSSWHHIVGVIDPDGDLVHLYVDGVLDGGSSGTLGAITLTDNDLTFGCLHNDSGYSNYTVCTVDEIRIINRAITQHETEKLATETPLSGATRAQPGSIILLYLAGTDENLVYKLFTGKVIDRITGGDPDNPVLVLNCEDLGEILHERTYSHEYTSPTQISTIIDDIVDDSAPELYLQVDTTNRSIANNFNDENLWSLLEKIAETATYSTGENGANFYVDPGGSLRFKRYGAFSCSEVLSDGGDGSAQNILGIETRTSIKDNPPLANNVKVIIFEEEFKPLNGDAYTESAEGWSSPDPTDTGYPQSDTGDKTGGTASIHFNTTNPGTVYRLRLNFGDIDLTEFDRVAWKLKYGSGLSIDDFSCRLWRSSTWTTDYYEETGITKGTAASWVEYSVDISDFSATGNPGNIVDTVQIQVNHSTQIGTGGFLIDELRFIRDEKAGTNSDTTSITDYGERCLRVVDKTITDLDYAGYVAENLVLNRKEPLVSVTVSTSGRGQLGYRPPMFVELTSLKDGILEETFQITRAVHRFNPSDGYICTLSLLAARDSTGTYSAKVKPAVGGLGIGLAQWRRIQNEAGLNSLRSRWI